MPISSDFVVSSNYAEVFLPVQSLPDFALEEFARYGDETAFIYTPTGRRYSYAEIIRTVKLLSKGLKWKYNLKKGDVVAMVVSNCPEFLVLFLAAQRLGATITTANPAYTVEEMEHQFVPAKVQLILTENEFLEKVEGVSKLLPYFRGIIHVRDCHGGKFTTIDDLLKLGTNSQEEEEEKLSLIDPKEDVACVLYSSGTTGLPKGVMLTHFTMVTNLCQTTLCRQPPNNRTGMTMPHRGDVIYIPFPYFHLGGIYMGLFWPLVQGATVICMPKYSPQEFLGNIQKYRINKLILPPPIQVFMVKSPMVSEYDLSSLRCIIAGAAPVSKDVAEELFQRLLNITDIVQIYGMTETSPLTHSSPSTPASRHKLDSIGILVPSTQCKVVDTQTGEVCGPLKPGELWIKGPQNMKGYLHNEEATKNMITPDRWLKTGDIGYFDKNEYFYISDRLKELIKVKGFQVPPAELEALILTHPSVAEVVVVGVPDAYSGELPRAYVVLRDNRYATEAEIQKFVAGHVASYKHLKGGVRFVDSVPKTGTGKLLRRELRDKARAEYMAQRSKV